MIHVQRPAQPPADVLTALAKPLKSGKSELEAAREYYQQLPTPKKVYEFRRYKADEVCLWLDDLYHEKCVYCESDYRATSARNIEHYRPKGGVTESQDHPGYWWLAGHWSNLMPSCIPCNSQRKHAVFNLGMTLEELDRARRTGKTKTSGKANAFPMRPGKQWVTAEGGQLSDEDPLLIDPSERDPSAHLRWVFDWDKSSSHLWSAKPLLPALAPVVLADGTEDPYGKASIAIYGLNRDGLLRTRMDEAVLLQRDATEIVDVERRASGPHSDPVEREAERQKQWGYLRAHEAVDQEYCGMAQAFIALFRAELDAYLATHPF
jgi:hypothetical protein